MKWEQFFKDVRRRPVIESQYLHLLYQNKNEVRLQLSRWVKQGKLHQLKRGYYILDEAYRETEIFEPYIAAILRTPSYISLEKALEMHHLIPDVIYPFTSVTTKRRPAEFVNPVGRFKYVCIKQDYFWGYRVIQHKQGKGYLAEPEKAIIDLFYFLKKRVSEAFIRSLRLQNTELLDQQKLLDYAGKMSVPFIWDAVDQLLEILKEAK